MEQSRSIRCRRDDRKKKEGPAGPGATLLCRVRVERKARAPHQAQGQQRAENSIECQTETGPPMWYAGVFNEQVMDEIKNAVAQKGGDYEPKVSFEA